MAHATQMWLTGSHMFGLNTKESDTDYTGVYFDRAEFINPFSTRDETIVEGETSIHSLPKFSHLLLKGNPNTLDLVFMPPVSPVYPIAGFIKHVKPHVIHADVLKAYAGYLTNQIDRGFKSSRRNNEERRMQVEEIGYDAKYLSHAYRLAVCLNKINETGTYFDINTDEEILKTARNIKVGNVYTKEGVLELIPSVPPLNPDIPGSDALRGAIIYYFQELF